MQSFLKSKARVYALVAVTILMQCCCCILPVGFQMQKDNPALRQAVERIEARLSDVPAVSAWLDGR